MTLEKQEFLSRYTALMLEYAQSFEEAPLLAIEGLGHEMVQSNIPPEDIGEMHDAAIRELMETSEFSAETVRAASLPLMQLLMAYGIAFREVRARHEIEHELIESQKLYQSVVEQVSDGIVIVQDGKNVYVNNAVANIWGRPAEDIVGMDYLALIHPDEHERMAKIHQQRLAGGGPSDPYEVRCLNENGDTLWVQMTGTVIEYQGRPAALVSAHNITERKQAEDALKESKCMYQAVVNQVSDGIAIVQDGKDVYVNAGVAKLWGRPAEDIVGRHFLDIVHPDEHERLAEIYKKRKAGDGPLAPYEIRCWSAKGEDRWVEMSGSMIQYEGRMADLVSVRDITERKQAEDALKETQARYAEAQNIAQLGHWVLALDKNELTWSDQIYRIFEVTLNKFDASYEAFLAIVHPEDRELVSSTYEKSVENKTPYNIEHRLLMKDGRVKWVNERCRTVYDKNNKPLISIGTVLDITERKKMEETLEKANKVIKSSNQSLRSLIDIAQVGIVVHRNGKILLANTYILKRMGVSSLDVVLGRDYAQFLHPDDRKGSLQRSKQVLEHGGNYKNMPVRATATSGECFDFEVSSTMIEYDGKEAVLTISVDMTEKNRATESLVKLSSAVEQTGELIIITNQAGIIEYVNPAFTSITGYSAEEALGQTPALLNSGNQDAAFYESMWKTIMAGKVWHGKVIDKRKDGSFYPAMLTISPVSDNTSGGITHYVGIQSDLSMLEDMEHRFHQAQKMEAIGTMVGGIAHNFNNMLAGMTGNLYLAKQKVQEQPYVLQRLSNVEELSGHAAEMIQQLLTFARKGMVSIKEMPLTPFINETLKLLSASVPENIMLHQDLCADDLMIKGDATQLHQVLANLVNNARDAVECVGKPCITITLELFHADNGFIEKHPDFKTGDYALMSVADNGIGIVERHLKHLFDPFFTTKEQSKGTGLGLSMVYGAVKTHLGFIEVDSNLGKGSAFHVYIPLMEEKEDSGDTEHALEITEGQDELILLVDDDPVMREVMAEVLEAMQYRVIIAEDGLKGFEVFKSHEQEISIALLDLIMPHVGGVELAEQIRAMKPELPVIFMTGYDQGLVLAGATQIQNSKTFSKPMDFNVLSHHIREMLDS